MTIMLSDEADNALSLEIVFMISIALAWHGITIYTLTLFAPLSLYSRLVGCDQTYDYYYYYYYIIAVRQC